MRVDFYLMGTQPAPAVAAMLARRVIEAGERLLLVSRDAAQLAAISHALWHHAPEAFLAHGEAGTPQAARQPILLAEELAEPANAARLALLADGQWREPPPGLMRLMLLFGGTQLDAARRLWQQLGGEAAIDRRFWKHEQGRWRQGP